MKLGNFRSRLSAGFCVIAPKPTVEIAPVAFTKAKSPRLKLRLAFAAYPIFIFYSRNSHFIQPQYNVFWYSAYFLVSYPIKIVVIFPKLGRPFT